MLHNNYAEVEENEQMKRSQIYQNNKPKPLPGIKPTRAYSNSKEAIKKKQEIAPVSNFKLSRFKKITSKTETYARKSLKQINEKDKAKEQKETKKEEKAKEAKNNTENKTEEKKGNEVKALSKKEEKM